ncbi:MAG: DnaJ domain-containing protein [Deltaproteobacteria bacterium]|nr:DnaJ domain-containing protein [Deltaproteobacteria bacterium]
MSDLYQILGLTRVTCDDDQVRRAYLERIKRFTPEHQPEEFARLNQAYERLRSAEKRAAYDFFNCDPGLNSPLEALNHSTLTAHLRTSPGADNLKELCRLCRQKK